MAKILTVCDEDTQSRLRAMLDPLGHEVAHAENGTAAICYCDSQPVALAIVDTGRAGDGALDAIRALVVAHPRLHMITISEAGTENFLAGHALAAELGAVATISRPIAAEELLFHVRACLEPLD